MLYEEHLPSPPLRPYVACFWTLRGTAGRLATGHRVLPDGCMDLVFHFGAVHLAQVGGVMTTALVTPAVAEGAHVDWIGVRFRPGEAAAYLGVPAREVRDGALPIEDVCGRWGRVLVERLGDAASLDARLAILEASLAVRSPTARPDPRLRRAIARLSGDARSVSALAADVGLCERQLLRLFDGHVGIGPKAFARTLRLQAVVRAIDAHGPVRPAWAAIAAAHAFADQAHLVRELKAMTGLTPDALHAERTRGRLGMSETFNPPATALGSVAECT